MEKPENRALEVYWWRMTRALGPTGMAGHLGARITAVLGRPWQGASQGHSLEEQGAALLQQAKKAYEVVRTQAQDAYARQKTTSARIKVLKVFARREPLLYHERWIRDLLVEASMTGNSALLDGIRGALSPRLPSVHGGDPQKKIAAQQYYRSVIARVSEDLLTDKNRTVTAAVRRVLALPETEERCRQAGLTSGLTAKAHTKSKEPNMEHRARQIYYTEIKPYVWRELVAAGVGLFEAGQVSNGYPITGFRSRVVAL